MKKLIIFGAGFYGKKALDYYGGNRVAFFADNNSLKIGGIYFGKKIIDFNTLKLLYNNFEILIAVKEYYPIKRQLLENGILDFRFFEDISINNLCHDKNNCTISNRVYTNHLYTPTQIEKINSYYFIVDCWHHRVIYSKKLNLPISEWKILDDELRNPHSIASDGDVLLVENTEAGEVCVYQFVENDFSKIQTVYGLGERPHKIIYDDKTDCFFVLLSEGMEIAILRKKKQKIIIEKIIKLVDDIIYCRSMRIIGKTLFLATGNGSIFEVEYQDLSFDIIKKYKVPNEIYEMNDIVFYKNNYYISVYKNVEKNIKPVLVRFQKFEQLINGYYENITDIWKIKGVPYFFSIIEDKLFLTEIDLCSRICVYIGGNKKVLFMSESIEDDDLQRRYERVREKEIEKERIENLFVRYINYKNSFVKDETGEKLRDTAAISYFIDKRKENLLNFYPFQKGANILEINPQMGRLTPLLCNNANSVYSLYCSEREKEAMEKNNRNYSNLKLIEDEKLQEIEKIFDYILVYITEDYIIKHSLDEIFSMLSNKITETGKILIITDNKIGSIYWNNSKEGYTSAMIQKRLYSNGLNNIVYYYPIPNWKKPEFVISSKQLTGNISEEELENLVSQKLQGNSEREKIIDMLQTNSLPVLSKSFLIECSKSKIK